VVSTTLPHEFYLGYPTAKTLHGHTVPLNESYATHNEEELLDISPELEGIVDDMLNALKDRVSAISISTYLSLIFIVVV
jgi:hypothetical protein